METKVNSCQIKAVLARWGYTNFFAVEPIGDSGGLLVTWKLEVSLEVLSSSPIIINTHAIFPQIIATWQISFVYGDPNRSFKNEVWNDLKQIEASIDMPCVVLGDFNEVTHINEKQGGKVKQGNAWRNFKVMIEDCNLIDLRSYGNRYTWSNHRSGAKLIRQRLNRVLVNSEWNVVYTNAIVFNEVSMGSDHSPIILQCFLGS
uniref:Endonuclease/exonuclease/phosphatase domain-containing protein n=1 Tax=Nelumbo nucifera TaxID=4432 RepID=A0A822ZRJ4_NELNU|nr:TPA_asm: hypothetical protein HUJ06_004371 [Nelumbo nucifera]